MHQAFRWMSSTSTGMASSTPPTKNLSRTWDGERVPSPVGLVGCGCSKTTFQVNTLALHTNFPIVSGTSTFPGLSDRTKYPNFWRTIQPDSRFMGAWLALLRTLGFSKMSAVVGETTVWSSYVEMLLKEAEEQGVQLEGDDLTSEIPGFHGYRVMQDATAAAAIAAEAVALKPTRMVLLAMYHTRSVITMCEFYKHGLVNTIFMVFGWYEPEWWLDGQDLHDCTPEQMTEMATGFISANILFWRSDRDQQLSCSDSMTAGAFHDEWEQRQAASPGPYAHAPEAASVADAVCMYAQMLHQILYVHNYTLDSVQKRTKEAYDMIQELFGATDFQGVTGRIALSPHLGSARQGEPDGAILLQHLQSSPSGVEVVDIAEYNRKVLTFLGLANLTFSLPGENYFAGPDGAHHIDVRMSDYKSCDSPMILDLADNECGSCPEGMTYAAQFETCSCRPGFAAAPGGKYCTSCAPGTFTEGAGSTECLMCATGRFAMDFGQTQCTRCGVGSYQDEKGRSQCKLCNRTMTTVGDGVESGGLCTCGPGTRPGGNGECEDCGDSDETGLVCKGGNDVELAPGFYAADDSLSVFRCREDSRCVGGPPGETCAAGREGIACADCVAGTGKSSDGTCVACRGDGIGWIALFGFSGLSIAFLAAMYVYIDLKGTSQRGHSFLLLALALSMCVTIIQQLGVLAMFTQVDWPHEVRHVLKLASLLTLDMEFFNFSCVARTSPLQRFVISIFTMVAAWIVLALVHIVAVFLRHKGNFRGRSTSLIASTGTIFMIFYISVLSNLLEPLQCLQNPNGSWTMQLSASVICWETQEHQTMVAIAMVALLVPLGYLAKCCHVVWCFPSRMHAGQVDYLQTYYFLFFRYRSECYWYSLVHMFRSLLLANLPVLPDAAAQILCMQAILLSQLYCIVAYRPWRVPVANQLDLFFTASVMFILGVAAFFVDVVGETLAEIVVGLCFIVFLLLPVCGIWSLYRRCQGNSGKRFNYFVCHHKAAAGSFARLLKMELCRTKAVSREVFIDTDNLVDLDGLFDVVACETEVLILVASEGVFLRPWCVGELVTAMERGVEGIRLLLPDFRQPDDEFIDDYQSYVGDLSVLSSRGIGVSQVQNAIRWACGLPWVAVPAALNDAKMHEVIEKATSCKRVEEQRVEELPEVQSSSSSRTSTTDSISACSSRAAVSAACSSRAAVSVMSKYRTFLGTTSMEIAAIVAPGEVEHCNYIVRDELNLEATCTGMILARLLYTHFAHVPEELPKVLGIGEPLPLAAKKVIFICTNGALEQENVLTTLSRGLDAGAKFIPVLLDDDFRFPTACFVREHFELAQKVAGTASGATALAEAVGDIFKMVALPFHSDVATELALKGQALEIAERLHRSDHHASVGGTSRSLRFIPVLLDNDSSTASSQNSQGVESATGNVDSSDAGADSRGLDVEAGERSGSTAPSVSTLDNRGADDRLSHTQHCAAFQATCWNDEPTRRGSWWSHMSTASDLYGAGVGRFSSGSLGVSEDQPSPDFIV